ncbi:hypothetical protein LTS18_009963, partial [Coniosporium uncinatum]
PFPTVQPFMQQIRADEAAAQEQFEQQVPWANPRIAAQQPRYSSYVFSTPATTGKRTTQPLTNGSASTVTIEANSNPPSSVIAAPGSSLTNEYGQREVADSPIPYAKRTASAASYAKSHPHHNESSEPSHPDWIPAAYANTDLASSSAAAHSFPTHHLPNESPSQRPPSTQYQRDPRDPFSASHYRPNHEPKGFHATELSRAAEGAALRSSPSMTTTTKKKEHGEPIDLMRRQGAGSMSATPVGVPIGRFAH